MRISPELLPYIIFLLAIFLTVFLFLNIYRVQSKQTLKKSGKVFLLLGIVLGLFALFCLGFILGILNCYGNMLF